MGEYTLSAGRGTLFLTALGTVSQILAFFYRAALSRLAGAEVMGLYQLLMPVYSVLLSVTAVGLTSAISNLTSQHLALGNRKAATQNVSACLKIFVLLLLPVGAGVIFASDAISVKLLGDARTQLGLILLVPCVALTGVENFHKHFFYGAGMVRPPAVVELLEQFIRTAAVLGLLMLFLPQYPERAVGLIVTGMVLCEVFSSLTLLWLYRRHMARMGRSGAGEPVRVRWRRIWGIALPVGLNALLGNLMSAANAALIPRKLVESGLTRGDAVSRFGIVCGMTLPMLALPTVFLGPLNLVLVPRLARANALGRGGEVQRLAGRAVAAVSVLTLPAMALMTVLGGDLGRMMFGQERVGEYLVPLAATMALSCYCSVLASILSGVGRQQATACISLLGSAVQLVFTLALVPLPGVGMAGYVTGALVCAVAEAALCFWCAVRYGALRPELFQWLTAPGLSALLAALTGNLLLRCLKDSGLHALLACAVVFLFSTVLYLAALHAQGVRPTEILRIR